MDILYLFLKAISTPKVNSTTKLISWVKTQLDGIKDEPIQLGINKKVIRRKYETSLCNNLVV